MVYWLNQSRCQYYSIKTAIVSLSNHGNTRICLGYSFMKLTRSNWPSPKKYILFCNLKTQLVTIKILHQHSKWLKQNNTIAISIYCFLSSPLVKLLFNYTDCFTTIYLPILTIYLPRCYATVKAASEIFWKTQGESFYLPFLGSSKSQNILQYWTCKFALMIFLCLSESLCRNNMDLFAFLRVI